PGGGAERERTEQSPRVATRGLSRTDSPMDPERIALIKPSALGDIVHALPVLSALRRRFPAAHVTWVVNRAYEPLLAGHPDLDETLPFDRGATAGGFLSAAAAALRLAAALRRRRFDRVLDLQALLRAGLPAA